MTFRMIDGRRFGVICITQINRWIKEWKDEKILRSGDTLVMRNTLDEKEFLVYRLDHIIIEEKNGE